jgi:hypothetical protein
MTDARLLPCPSCARHVRVSDEMCPFCAAALSDSRRSLPLPRTPASRLSRAALFAFGASAAAVAACGGTTSALDDAGTGDGGREATVFQPPYGAAPPFDAGEDAFPTVDAAYGGPPQDAGSDADASGQPDGIAPPYGAPP